MSRTLSAATIIPSELYVERAADRQLRDIVEGMGRPGYVLVARQMGKTNLLLNARRRLEKPDFRFVYVDLSLRLESLENYFALLLNTAQAVHPDLFNGLDISDFPQERYTPAKFEVALRSILKHYKGKLVFVLDEIDSLANYSFSDRVFSHIRSMYFSRANFEDYGRITYVLSGVAEPSELIRDKNVSPFNIGQKIFLNDFSDEEFRLFLKKANLALDRAASERIFYWAGGNPRLTWDICAEVETIAQNRAVTTVDIDEIVATLYLTTYDRAPVDHIRTLAQTDREIRAAVRAIRSGDSSEISDRVRNRLYLAGITSMQSEGAGTTVLRIKNHIIDATLSDRWLNDVEKQSRSNLQLGRENYEEKLFEPAVAFFEEYLIDNEIDFGSVDAYRLATSYFHTRRYEKAIDWLTKYSERTESAEIQSDVSFMIGRGNLVLNKFEEAAKAFRRVIDLGAKSFAPLAKGLLASSLLQMDTLGNAKEIRNLCESALDFAETLSKPDQAANARVVALLNLAALEEAENRKLKALELITRAEMEDCPPYRPLIILNSLNVLDAGKRREQLLDELADSIISLFSAPQEQRLDALSDSIVLSALVALRLNNHQTDFERLLNFYVSTKDGSSQSLPSVYVSLYSAASKISANDSTIFLKDLIERFGEHGPSLDSVLEATRTLLLLEQDSSVGPQYLSVLAKATQSQLKVTDADHVAIVVFIVSALRTDNIDALSSIDAFPQNPSLNGPDPTFGELYHASFEIRRLERLGRVDASLELAQRLARFFASNSRAVRLFSDETRKALVGIAQDVIEKYSPSVIAIPKGIAKYGRNSKMTVEYQDGRQISTKFKLVQRDIALGKCKIIAE